MDVMVFESEWRQSGTSPLFDFAFTAARGTMEDTTSAEDVLRLLPECATDWQALLLGHLHAQMEASDIKAGDKP
jgi:hypothetical protein